MIIRKNNWLSSALAFAFLCFAFCGLMVNNVGFAQQIEFVERFVLSANREAELSRLVPGSEEFYFYSALDNQLREKHGEVNKLLKAWAENIGETERFHEIRTREMLLTYDRNPQATLDFLIWQLGLRFDHEREIPAAERNLPNTLPDVELNLDPLFENALANRSTTDGVEVAGMEELMRRFDKLTESQKTHCLSRIQTSTSESLIKWVANDLTRDPNPTQFGQLGIHSQLTLAQMDLLADSIPSLRNNDLYLHLYCRKLKPNADENPLVDPNVMRTYLETVWAFVSKLEESQNSLKANILFNLLKADLHSDKPNLERFKKYLLLPRPLPYVNPDLLRETAAIKYPVQLGQDFTSAIGMPPIQNDVSLVLRYLQHFLRDANSPAEFEKYFEETFLKKEFAKVKILNGLGDWERWSTVLSPAEYKELVDRVELEFAPTNPTHYGADDLVSLNVDVKNVNDLVVKIFEINTENYYKQFGRIVDTDINLDGLVPNWEHSYRYSEKPAIRKRQTFSFPELDHLGVFVIDFIGNGQSCRALVQKGRLSATQMITSAGHVFSVFSESGYQLKSSTAFVGNRRFEANEAGFIVVPFSTSPGPVSVIIQNESLCALSTLDHQAENYELTAGIFIDREQLIRNRKAKVIVRPSLSVAGMPIAIDDRLQELELSVTTINHDSQKSQKSFRELTLSEKGELEVEFQVPPRLSQVLVQLSGKVRNISQNRDDLVSASQTIVVNQIDNSDEIADVHLQRSGDDYFLEILGMSGESRSKIAARVELKHKMFTEPVVAMLQSDDSARISLGQLPGIDRIAVTVTGGTVRTWDISRLQLRQTYRSLTGNRKTQFIVPIPPGLTLTKDSGVALFELRDQLVASDLTKRLSVSEEAVIVSDLEPGDYEINFGGHSETTRITVTDGEVVNNLIVGNHRILETSNNKPLFVDNPKIIGDKLAVKLHGLSGSTRVHIIATRYVPVFNAFDWLNTRIYLEPLLYRRAATFNAFISGRVIGDEYRYVIDRQSTTKFPGNMLDRPSLLLAPWSLGPTENREQFLADSTRFGEAANALAESANREPSGSTSAALPTAFSNLDFLKELSFVLNDLKPDENGFVEIDISKLGEHTHFTIVAVDNFEMIQKTATLATQVYAKRDLRLDRALDGDHPVAQRKSIEIVDAGQKFMVKDILTAKFRAFQDLKSVFNLYEGLAPDSGIAEWRFLLDWPTLKEEERLEKYAKYACHELNFYIWKKDRDFFNKHIRTFLANKFQKTFLDRWLLEEDVSAFLEPKTFATLNTFEQILLAQRDESRGDDIIRLLTDRYELAPLQQVRIDYLFDTAIASSSLEETESTVEYQEELERLRDQSKNSTSGELYFAAPSPGNNPVASDRGGIAGDSPAIVMPNDELLGAMGGQGARGQKGGFSEGVDPRFSGLEDKAVKFDADDNIDLLSRQDSNSLDELYSKKSRVDLDGRDFRFLKDAEISSGKSVKFFQQVAPTEEWVENNFYRIHPDVKTSDIVTTNEFWNDWARNGNQVPFLSTHFAEASNNLHEILLALAVLDLPVKTEEPKSEFVENSLNWTSNSDAIMVHQQIRPTPLAQGNTTILVSENYFRKNDRYIIENNIQYDKFINDRFTTHSLYGAQVVITNPTSTPRVVELLMQIPEGALATSGSQETRSLKLLLAAFSSQSFEYYFYFPTAGTFKHFPAHVADDENILAVAQSRGFEVTDEPTPIDKKSWAFISQYGAEDEVLKFLNVENLQKIDLEKIAFRMKDKEFYQKATRILRQRCIYHHSLWSYSVKHNDAQAMAEYLENEAAVVNRVGDFIDSSILKIDSVESNGYEHREYWPLINIRAHQVRRDREILNNKIHWQYHRLMNYLAYKPSLSTADQLSVTYYLFLQDRVEEGLNWFSRIGRSDTNCELQYDYLAAYAKLYESDSDGAAEIANRYIGYPISSWRNRFSVVLKQIAEIRGESTGLIDPDSRAELQAKLAAEAPSFDFEVKGNEIKVTYNNLPEVVVNYYLMDAELLFSTNPFDALNVESFSLILPNANETKALPNDKKEFSFELPEEFRTRNLLVEIQGGEQTNAKPVYANGLDVQIVNSFGQLKVANAKDGKPLPKTYVKVYSMDANGIVKFYKDGYTDLRGRFDYASQSNLSTDDLVKFSILIQNDLYGTVIRETEPPKQ